MALGLGHILTRGSHKWSVVLAGGSVRGVGLPATCLILLHRLQLVDYLVALTLDHVTVGKWLAARIENTTQTAVTDGELPTPAGVQL